MRISEDLASASATADPLVDYLSGQVDLALITGDHIKAQKFLGEMQKSAPKYESRRLRNDLLLYRVRVEQICSERPISSEDLTELLRFHEIGKRFGRHDDHMDVLWVALNSVGRSAEATRLLQEYLTIHRRERRSCRYFLRMRTEHDPAWKLKNLGPGTTN
jgi:hypothetical protein